LLGTGGFGEVYLMPNGNVIKLIKDPQDCKTASIEFEKQKKYMNLSVN
jgi:hypothetical protein